MRISINVRIDAEPQDQSRGSYGQMSFSEDVSIEKADFSIASAVFSKCHELLQAIELQHRAVPRR